MLTLEAPHAITESELSPEAAGLQAAQAEHTEFSILRMAMYETLAGIGYEGPQLSDEGLVTVPPMKPYDVLPTVLTTPELMAMPTVKDARITLQLVPPMSYRPSYFDDHRRRIVSVQEDGVIQQRHAQTQLARFRAQTQVEKLFPAIQTPEAVEAVIGDTPAQLTRFPKLRKLGALLLGRSTNHEEPTSQRSLRRSMV